MTTKTTPDYEADADLSNVSEGDRVTFTTRTNRSNGIPIQNSKTVTVDEVTVEERDGLESVEVEPDVIEYREVDETHVEVVAIEDDYRYTLRQTDDGTVRVSSCKQSDYVDQYERGEANAVARSNVSHGYITSWSHDRVATDGGRDVANAPDNPNADSYAAHEDEDGVLAPSKVAFNPDGVAAAWEATDGVVPMVAAPIANAFATDDAGHYFAVDPHDGVESDGDTVFVDVEGEDGEHYKVLVEEKAVGVVGRDTDVPARCKKVALRNDDRRALYVNPAQIFVDRV